MARWSMLALVLTVGALGGARATAATNIYNDQYLTVTRFDNLDDTHLYRFVSNDHGGDYDDMWDLDHYKVVTWGINWWDIPDTQVVTGAYLRITKLYNWDKNPNILHIALLDDPLVGARQPYDDNQDASNYFDVANPAITHLNLTTYTDNDGPDTKVTFEYHLNAQQLNTMKQWAQNGGTSTWGLGLDPDCHFYNTGVKFYVETGEAPGLPAIALLAVPGVAGAVMRRRRRQK